MADKMGAMRRLGVFATLRGWLLTDNEQRKTFASRADALAAARQQAHVARWRGAEAEVVAQDRVGGALTVVDPAPRRARENA
ncbi:MAG TPA: hypothetical protein VMT68_14985 [Caulobacteraceae bacterium]|nr:hypothetical protein [Caulobacteraceae bacterium]